MLKPSNVHSVLRTAGRLQPAFRHILTPRRLSPFKLASEEHGGKLDCAADGGTAQAEAAPATLPAAEPAAPPRKPAKAQPKKGPPAPAALSPPSLPDDPTCWENAVLLIDKPPGWTSFDVCNKVRGQLAALLRCKPMKVKVGHAGTLDPAATGLLIVCVGKATKSIDSFMALQKEYSGVLRLGESTASYDAETEVAESRPWEHVTDEALFAARDTFVGDIQQIPPMYSALRVGGKRLYESARAGKEVERQPRPVHVARFDLQRSQASPRDVEYYVVCSKGTYIRSLAHDVGIAAGTLAHITALRREAIGPHRVKHAWNMAQLQEQLQQKIAVARGHAVQGGAPVQQPAVPAVAVETEKKDTEQASAETEDVGAAAEAAAAEASTAQS